MSSSDGAFSNIVSITSCPFSSTCFINSCLSFLICLLFSSHRLTYHYFHILPLFSIILNIKKEPIFFDKLDFYLAGHTDLHRTLESN